MSPTGCTLLGTKEYQAEGQKVAVAYVFDKSLGIKVFADKASYSVSPGSGSFVDIVPFLLKKDARAYAEKHNGKLATYSEALTAAWR
jgi:NitT/TauT family transport system substrate-binding protein